MFVRKKPNKSGSISVQVIDKSSGSYKVVKTLGSSQDPVQVKQLVRRAHQWISHHTGQSELDFHDVKTVVFIVYFGHSTSDGSRNRIVAWQAL